MIDHGTMIRTCEAVRNSLGMRSSDRVLGYASIGSDFGFYNVFVPLFIGACVILAKNSPRLPIELLDTIREAGVTALHGMPPLINTLSEMTPSDSGEIRTLRYVASTGQPLPTSCITRLRDLLPFIDVYSMYGMTECKRISCLSASHLDSRPSSVGLPLPGLRLHLLDENLVPVSQANTVGQLAVAGDLVMSGYWCDDALTRTKLRHDLCGEDQLFLTGDLFRRDEEGFLYYIGRRDRQFGRGGFKANPGEIERCLESLPQVRHAVVTAVRDHHHGFMPEATVELRDGLRIGSDELIAHCAAVLDWHMVPTAVHFKRLSITPSGKLSK